MADTRTDAEKVADLQLYGSCAVCKTPRTVTRSDLPGGGIMASLVCPAGCMVIEEGGVHA
jgi:hypothetical protein